MHIEAPPPPSPVSTHPASLLSSLCVALLHQRILPPARVPVRGAAQEFTGERDLWASADEAQP